jgi:hypothetical protein
MTGIDRCPSDRAIVERINARYRGVETQQRKTVAASPKSCPKGLGLA